MGMLTRMTEAALADLGEDGWADVWDEMIAKGGLPAVFESRGWSWSAFNKWMEGHPERREEYFRARAWAADAKMHEVVPIADREGDVQRDKLRISARSLVAKSWDAATYGDRASQININASGGLVTLLSGMPHAGRLERVRPEDEDEKEAIDVKPNEPIAVQP